MIFLGEGSSATQWILPAVLLVLVIGIFVLNYFRSKKNQDSMKNMVESLKVGDNVKTYSGLYGKIIEIVETTDGKMAILETGSEKNKGIFSIDINAIYGIDAKEAVTYDADGNIINPNATAEVKTEEVKEEKKDKKGKKGKKEKESEVIDIENIKEPVAEENTTVEEKPAEPKAKKTVKKAKKTE